MDSCWAQCLGGCSDKISREHLVSKNLFLGKTVSVLGLPSCKDKPKRIGLSSLTSKILCTRHNNELSPVDKSGGEAFAVFRELERLGNVRNSLKPQRWNVKRYQIDGSMLERWLLKTLFNLCAHENLPIGSESQVPGRPSDALVKCAFGLETLPERSGAYIAASVGLDIAEGDNVAFCPLIKNGSYIDGGLFLFRNIGFALYLNPAGLPRRVTGNSIGIPYFKDCEYYRHHPEIALRVGGFLSQVISFSWSTT